MREHADPGRDDLASSAPVTTAITPGRALRRRGVDALDPARARAGCARRRRAPCAAAHVVDELPRPCTSRAGIRPRHRPADVGVRPVERRVGRVAARSTIFIAWPPRCLRHRFDRIDDGVIAGAAAVVAGDVLADLVARSAARRCASRSCAVSSMPGVQKPHCSALRSLERLLQVGDLARVRQALDGLDLGAVACAGEHQAAAHDRAVDPHRAGAADAVLAADVRAGEPQVLAQEIDEVSCAPRRARTTGSPLTVSVMSTCAAHGRASASRLATRRSSTPARWFFVAAVACTSSCGSRSSRALSPRLRHHRPRALPRPFWRALACCRRRKRRGVRRDSPMPSALRARGQSHHRVVAMAASELGEADTCVFCRGRNTDRGQHVGRSECGLEQAREEIVGLHRALALRPAISTSPSSASRQAGSSAAGSAKAIEPPMVPRLLIAAWPICGMRQCDQRRVPGNVGGALGLDVAGEGTDLNLAILDGNPGQTADAVEVDQQLRRGQPHVERGHQALAAGEQPRLAIGATEQLNGMLHRFRLGIGKRRRLPRSTSRFTCSFVS